MGKEVAFGIRCDTKAGDNIEITDDIRSFLVDAYLSVGEEGKALGAWKAIHKESAALTIVDKFISRRKLAEASNILEEIVSVSKPVPEVHLVTKLAIIYAYREMSGKGFEILNQFPVTSQSKSIIEITKAEILAFAGRYEEALSILHTLREDETIGLRPQIIELECYYALEKDEMLLEKSSLILQKLSPGEQVDTSKVLTLRILSQIRMGLYKNAEKEIELLSKIDTRDLGPAILTVLFHDAQRQLKECEASNQVLGKVLSSVSTETEMTRPQLLDDVPLSAWKIADELAMHRNPEVSVQRAKVEFKAGNFQQSLRLYKEMDESRTDPGYKLGMVECYLNLNEEEEANCIFEGIQLPMVTEKEVARYFEVLVRLRRNKQALYAGLSLFADFRETKAVYCYDGKPAVEYGSLPSDAMAYFAAQVLVIRTDALQTSLRNRLGEKSLVQNYYGQSLAFFPLSLEEGILKRP